MSGTAFDLPSSGFAARGRARREIEFHRALEAYMAGYRRRLAATASDAGRAGGGSHAQPAGWIPRRRATAEAGR